MALTRNPVRAVTKAPVPSVGGCMYLLKFQLENARGTNKTWLPLLFMCFIKYSYTLNPPTLNNSIRKCICSKTIAKRNWWKQNFLRIWLRINRIFYWRLEIFWSPKNMCLLWKSRSKYTEMRRSVPDPGPVFLFDVLLSLLQVTSQRFIDPRSDISIWAEDNDKGFYYYNSAFW